MKRQFHSVMLCLLAALLLLPIPARAAQPISFTDRLTLTLSYRDGDVALPGARFQLYLVSQADERGGLTVTEDFRDFAVDLDAAEGDAWRTLAQTLEAYAIRYRVKPADSGETNRRGLVTFPTGGKTLTPGLYLVSGDRLRYNGRYYDPSPFLVMLPTLNVEEDCWEYAVEASPKFDSHPTPPAPVNPEEPGEDTVTRKVLKIWADGDENTLHPSITVQLLRDDQVYDTVTLSDFNGWSYTWTDLDSNYRWRVVELVPEGYTVSISREGITFVIVNTPEDTTEKPDKPENPDKPDKPEEPENPEKPEQPTRPEAPETPAKPTRPEDELPKTGQLWWPVPALLCAGLLLVIVGLLRRGGVRDAE